MQIGNFVAENANKGDSLTINDAVNKRDELFRFYENYGNGGIKIDIDSQNH